MTAIATMPREYTPVRKAQPIDFKGMLDVARELVGTGFLPKHITTPGQCVAIILAGRELGMEPMLSLRSITMVQGKIVVAADAQFALFKAAGGRGVFESLTDTAAILKLTHPNGDTHTEAFTMMDAKRAGLTNNPTWSKYPKAMLRSRVITAGLKSVGFEPTAGAYDPEEMQSVVVEGENGANPTSGENGSGTPAPTTSDDSMKSTTSLNQHGSAAATQPTSTGENGAERTIEWARDFPIPHGPLQGQKLGVCGKKQLGVFLEWADGKIAEQGDATDAAILDFRAACALLLETKSSTSVKVPEPGKVEDALQPSDKWEADGWKTLPQNVIAEDPNSPLPF